MKTSYATGDAETSVAWNKLITTMEATPNKFGGSPSGPHLEVD
jgi:hypothetical protein